jgi:hypothetical protein
MTVLPRTGSNSNRSGPGGTGVEVGVKVGVKVGVEVATMISPVTPASLLSVSTVFSRIAVLVAGEIGTGVALGASAVNGDTNVASGVGTTATGSG